MYMEQSITAGRDRLRMLYGESVVSQPLVTDATYGDIARMLNDETRLRHGNPIAINVLMAKRPVTTPPRTSNAA